MRTKGSPKAKKAAFPAVFAAPEFARQRQYALIKAAPIVK